MENISTELMLSLALTEEERSKSLDLNVGFIKEFNEWELIIKYSGNIDELSQKLGFEYTELLAFYAIIRIKSYLIEALSREKSVIFVEKPKSLFIEQIDIQNTNRLRNEKLVSCMSELYSEPYELNGTGVICSVIDSGIDYKHPVFLRNGSTIIYELWDQSEFGNPPTGYSLGYLYDEGDINNALESNESQISSLDITGHGTAVASIITECVPESKLLVIKLADGNNGFPKTTSLMQAIDYSVRLSINTGIPISINLSFGNNYGDHSSNSVLEDYIDSVSNLAKCSIITGTGNDGNAGRHAQILLGNVSWQEVDFLVSDSERGINLQIWNSFNDLFDIILYTPSGEELGPFNRYQDVIQYRVNEMRIDVIKNIPSPINPNQETYISIIPDNQYIASGLWRILIRPKSIVNGRIDLWLPVEGSTSSNVRFTNNSIFTTLTIPSTANRVISVGAYNSDTLSFASFSGRGFTVNGDIKPDLVAPGVNIYVAYPGGEYRNVSGTSFATPFVTSAAAMLMQYGIVNENDTFLTGERLKSYLIRGARPLPGVSVYPSQEIGWGALCVRDSLPN